MLIFKLVMQICLADQPKAAWFKRCCAKFHLTFVDVTASLATGQIVDTSEI